jgi:peptide/nickel transport system substrate-binding protein
MKKFVLLFVCLFAFVSMIAGCSSGGTATPTSPALSTTSSSVTPSTAVPTPSASTSPAVPVDKTSAPNKTGGTFVYITAGGPGGPFGVPWASSGGSTFSMQFSMNTILKEGADGSLAPCLAESYDVDNSPASPSITFHLRKGVEFSDGTDFNAQAVKWNLEQDMQPTSTTVRSTSNWKSLEVLDDYTLKINLKSWQNTAVETFANAIAFMASPTAFQKNGVDWMNYNMVGTGPFIQTSFQRDVALNFSRNANYWEQGKPYVDKLQYLFVPDAMTAEAFFKGGGGQVLQCYNDKMANDLKLAGFNIISYPGFTYTMYPDSMDADSPWSNLTFRQAAEYALDKDSMAKAFGYGTWISSYQPSGPNSPAYDSSLTPRKYDPVKAKQLMTEAGYPDGVKTTIYVSPNGANQDLALAIQANWAAVGIKADLQYPQAGAWSSMQTGTWKNGVLFGAGALAANPNTGWGNYTKGSAWWKSMKRPDTFPDLYTASLDSLNLDPELLKKCEDALYDDVTTIPLFITPTTWAVTDSLHDSGLGTRNLFSWFEPQNLWLSK